MSRSIPCLVLVSLLAGCARTSSTVSEDSQSSPGTVELVTRKFNLRPLASGATPDQESAAGSPNGGPGTAASFGIYVLALSWAPNFCCGNPGREECAQLPGSFGGTHLTIHGLWPNYTDAEMPRPGVTYPTFCSPYSSCKKHPTAECNPDPQTIPPDMKTYGPGYVSDSYLLANHEWPKHGSCTGLDSNTYFSAAISALKNLPGDQGTPDLLAKNVGGTVAATDLRAAFGSPESVMLSCDASCNLQQVSICLTKGDTGLPTTRTACPSNTTTTAYDNGCFVNGCQNVKIQSAGQCGS